MELPGLFGVPDPGGPPGTSAPDDPRPVPLHAEPAAESRLVATVSLRDDIEWREFTYEAPAAMAYGVRHGWVRIALRDGEPRRFGWVPPAHTGSLHRLEALLEDGLAYMTPAWDGALLDAPSTAAPSSRHDRVQAEDLDMRVLNVLERDGRLWLRVTLLGPGRCAGVAEPAAIATGWVPALSEDGRPNAWFYSRGC